MISIDLKTTENLATNLIMAQTHVVSEHLKRGFGGLDFSSLCLKLVFSPEVDVSFLYWQCLHVLEFYLKTTGRR